MVNHEKGGSEETKEAKTEVESKKAKTGVKLEDHQRGVKFTYGKYNFHTKSPQVNTPSLPIEAKEHPWLTSQIEALQK